MFTKEVSDQLKYYVYRLIDPRNGESFYVGKGTGNRVFAHVKGELGSDADALPDKLQRIRDIRVDGFEVAHVIHRHGLDQQTAFEVEAALIDIRGGNAARPTRSSMHFRELPVLTAPDFPPRPRTFPSLTTVRGLLAVKGLR